MLPKFQNEAITINGNITKLLKITHFYLFKKKIHWRLKQIYPINERNKLMPFYFTEILRYNNFSLLKKGIIYKEKRKKDWHYILLKYIDHSILFGFIKTDAQLYIP